MKKLSILFILTFLASLNSLYAHPGRTDSKGCHKDRKNGTYHCHNNKAFSQIEQKHDKEEEDSMFTGEEPNLRLKELQEKNPENSPSLPEESREMTGEELPAMPSIL